MISSKAEAIFDLYLAENAQYNVSSPREMMSKI
jgi:hypothetical protein